MTWAIMIFEKTNNCNDFYQLVWPFCIEANDHLPTQSSASPKVASGEAEPFVGSSECDNIHENFTGPVNNLRSIDSSTPIRVT